MSNIIIGALSMFFWVTIVYLVMVGSVLYVKGKDVHRASGRTSRHFHDGLIQQHQDLAKMFLAGSIFLLVIVESLVRMGGFAERGWLFYLHLVFAVPGLSLLLLTYYRFNGRQVYRYKHGRIARLTLTMMAGTLVTGIFLFIN